MFSKEMRRQIQADSPEMSFGDVSRLVGVKVEELFLFSSVLFIEIYFLRTLNLELQKFLFYGELLFPLSCLFSPAVGPYPNEIKSSFVSVV